MPGKSRIEPVRFTNSMTIRCQPEITKAIDVASRLSGRKPSEWVRQAILAGLRADGIIPVGE